MIIYEDAIIIKSFQWIEDRQDFEVDYIDKRNGLEEGRRYIKLPEKSNETDLIEFIMNETK